MRTSVIARLACILSTAIAQTVVLEAPVSGGNRAARISVRAGGEVVRMDRPAPAEWLVFTRLPAAVALPYWASPRFSASRDGMRVEVDTRLFGFLCVVAAAIVLAELVALVAARRRSRPFPGYAALWTLAFPLPAVLAGLVFAEYALPRLADPTAALPYVHPIWYLPALLMATLVGWAAGLRALRGFVRRRRSAAGLCADCGYDLHATPDRCPECGTTKVTA